MRVERQEANEKYLVIEFLSPHRSVRYGGSAYKNARDRLCKGVGSWAKTQIQ